MKIYALNFLKDETIEEYAKILDQLKKDGIPTIEPVKGIDGRFLQKFTHKNIVYQSSLSQFVELSEFSENYLNKSVAEELATTLSKLHSSLNKIAASKNTRTLKPIETLNSLLTDEVLTKIKEYFKENIERQERLNKYLEKYLHDGNNLLNYFQERKEMLKKQELIHGDFQLTNLNIHDGKIKTIFDFDEMTLAPISFEIGCSITHLDEGFMLTDDLIEVFIKKYKEFKNLSKQDIKDIIMFMQYRCFYRISRWFTYYRFSTNAVEHFSKYQYKLDRYKQLNIDELTKFIEE